MISIKINDLFIRVDSETESSSYSSFDSIASKKIYNWCQADLGRYKSFVGCRLIYP